MTNQEKSMTDTPWGTLWKVWAKDANVPEDKIEAWLQNPNKQYHCVFCGTHRDFTTGIVHKGKPIGFLYCYPCRDYKGIEPCIPGHCEFGEE